MTEENKLESEIDSNKKNINNIRCTFCSSLILRPTCSYLTEDEVIYICNKINKLYELIF